MAYLYEELKKYCSTDYYPFHMPGHKRRLGGFDDPVSFDITEIDGFDNLHHAEGILAEAQKRAADLYGAEETCFLVNGSTGGILSAIGTCAPEGTLLMSRNSHKAAYHAVFLNRLETVYLYPGKCGCGPVHTEMVRRELERNADIRAVFLTSPTYDGVVSDVRKIAKTAHEFGVPLIVDAAHGAHFGMHPDFPENAVKQGADVVIHSLHKTLPSLTQTALLHVNGPLVDRKRLRKMLDIYQTSSPSYVLMASMDECIRLLQTKGPELFEAFAGRLRKFREEVRDLKVLQLPKTDDPSKILILGGASGLSGLEIARRLRETYHLETEMAAGSYVLALTSVGDEKEGFERLAQALREMDDTLCEDLKKIHCREAKPATLWNDSDTDRNEICMTIAEAENRPRRRIRLDRCENCISGEYVYLYPPGIPLVVPGERIGKALLERMLNYRERGYSLQGMEDYEMKYIQTIDGIV